MCGIAGIIGRIGPANRDALKRMNDALRHRGPDGEGFWESTADEAGSGVMLAHRRLAILDLSNAASQPMVDPTSGDVVVLNGEIYNYVALRDEMAATGERFQSNGDTAVMLRALSLRGDAAVGALRGMFAFAFWDVDGRRLSLARDPLGIKPLYVVRNPDPNGTWSVVFASEVRAILASGLLGRPRLDPSAAASMAWNGFIVSPNTAIQGVESLMPGELSVFDGRGRELKREPYWQLAAPRSETPISEAELSEVLSESVRLHLASDVPLGVFLSGGIDSSVVANLAQKSSTTAVNSFTLAFDEAEHNESAYARRIAAAIGTRFQEVVLTQQRFLGSLESALDSLDQPTFDGLNSYFMSHAVRDAGFTVALVGSGGDELFGGYTSFRDLPRLHGAAKAIRWIPKGLQSAVARRLSSHLQPSPGNFPPQMRWSKLADMVDRSHDLLAMYQLAYALFLPSAQRLLLSDMTQASLIDGLSPNMHQRLVAETQARSPLAAISVMEQRVFLGERLLRDTDSVSMSASLETRLPLVDQILLAQVNRLPDAERFCPVRTKAALRRMGLRGLDPALFNRPKSGFVLPYDRWLRGNVGRKVDSTLRDEDAVRSAGLNPATVATLWTAFQNRAPGLYWSRVWSIYVFVRWCQRHGASI